MEDDDIEIARYFKSNLVAVRRAIDADDFRKFVNLEKNSERVAFILKYPEAHVLPLEIEDAPVKNLEKALKIKESGNKFYSQGNFMKALETYSNAVLITPKKELGIFLANRSAALHNLELYDLALKDINEALRIGYPKELIYKIEERRAKCHLAMKNHPAAVDSFRNTLQALDHAKLPLERKQKLESDVRLMLAMMEKSKQLSEGNKTSVNQQTKGVDYTSSVPKMKDVNPAYPACSSAVEIRDAGGDIGRHGIATRDIMPGEVIMIEKPYCAVVLGEYRLTNCHYCFKKNIAPFPAACDTCALIAYCSANCRDADAKAHINECNILGPLWLSNASITCLLAIKAVIQKPYAKLRKLKEAIEKSDKTFQASKDHPFRASDYMAFYSMVTHESERTQEDLFHRAYMAAWLLRVLKKSCYLPEEVKTQDLAGCPLSEDEEFFGGLLFHHLQLLQFNTHEISELVRPRNDHTLQKAKSNFIAGGLFCTPALLNHSCNPGIVRYFEGTTMVVRAIRTIRAGMEICDNYGPIFTMEPKGERQRKLRLKYWFECGCEACVGNWPLLEDINPKILRFRCESGPSCGNVLSVNVDINEFMLNCSKCGKSTNIMKGLKALQDTDALFKLASRQLEDGEHNKALKTYLDILKLFDETLALPIRDYHLCQQGVRLCMLPLGNTAWQSLINL
ncbi:SET and MYND domain-containing protein 4 [Fopius arisanus]|uniref:Protein-lysine N-methyltransferase SMYD4 n=2 Tax=Fopius arisanus TaxID=64838 RepID=A0A9R1TSM7_9HYME|nr:PREDICTED: SET and MYND domain-containing protein 4 [Fopius arisanus]